jgi:hypothetical protein
MRNSQILKILIKEAIQTLDVSNLPSSEVKKIQDKNKNNKSLALSSTDEKTGDGKGLSEDINPIDVVKVDVPLLIRLMEYAKEDASTDMDLHDVAERLVELSKTGNTLTMDNYETIIG